MPLLDKVEAGKLAIPSPWSKRPKRSDASLPPEELKLLADAEIRFNQAFMERRYGLRGARSPELILEAKSYMDLLCRDLGVEVERKRYRMRERRGGELPMEKTSWWGKIKNWLREYSEPYVASDLKGIVDEFLRNREKELKKEK